MTLFNESFQSDVIRRTYREPETPDKPTGKTAVQIAADSWLAYEKQQDAKREAEEKRRLDERRQREQQRQAAERNAVRRKEVAARQQAFLLQERQDELVRDLERDMRDRIGLK